MQKELTETAALRYLKDKGNIRMREKLKVDPDDQVIHVYSGAPNKNIVETTLT